VAPLDEHQLARGHRAKVKGNPYKIQPMIWYTAPFEDIELN